MDYVKEERAITGVWNLPQIDLKKCIRWSGCTCSGSNYILFFRKLTFMLLWDEVPSIILLIHFKLQSSSPMTRCQLWFSSNCSYFCIWYKDSELMQINEQQRKNWSCIELALVLDVAKSCGHLYSPVDIFWSGKRDPFYGETKEKLLNWTP